MFHVAAAALLAAMAPAHAEPEPTRAAPCGTETLGEGRVAAIEDAWTLRLADGRAIRLTGIAWLVPPDEAKSALSGRLLHRDVILKAAKSAPVPDRYGRIHAFPFVSGSETPIQYAFLDEGLAVTGSRVGEPACRDALLARERAARSAGPATRRDTGLEPRLDARLDTRFDTRLGTRLGIAGSGDYRLLQADDPAVILKSLGRFAIVEGRVLSVRESGSTIYVNFGRRWSEDFTVTIAKRSEATFVSAGVPPKSLSGRTLRVRGVIEERSGPWIEATGPEQFDWDGRP